MKNSFKALSIIALTVLAVSSCTKDFVTVKHNSSEPQSEYYINESRMFEGLVAAYDPLHWYDYFYQYTALNMMSDIMSDDIYCGGSNDGDQPSLVKIHYFTSTPTEIVNVPWTTSYSGINRCCHVLENVDKVPGMSDDSKKLFKAEATALRAYYYTVLWKFYGNVPYYDKNLTTPYTAPQLKADEIYTKIVEDLEAVIAMNILPMKQSPDKYGRVTLAMVYMLYAEVVMYQNDNSRYNTALTYMQNIINSHSYSLVADYDGIWAETGEWGAESIWEINYINEGGVRDWGAPIAVGGSVYPVLIGIPGGVAGQYVDGWGFSPVAAKTYEMFGEGDVRRDGTIYNHLAVVGEYGNGINGGRWQSTGYFLKKYIARVNGNHGYKASDNLNYGNNQRVYRYAETLLNAAELSALLNQDGSKYLKEVRDIRNCKDTDTSIDGILEERHKEFVGEGKRYWDLVRTGKAASVLTAASRAFDGSQPIDWTPNKKYWPIPQSECDKDKNIVQNNY
ncbi:MAG: RagB/SusD family nutrient uptake outer membrane protein [Bacteroidales bacterium]|nr:RagB/SusD family nutrient uptake outer membrane protein [Bacteroidales bacterium]